ncbi:MAG: TonB-dependent receptor, partial [Terriglobia bacterium]
HLKDTFTPAPGLTAHLSLFYHDDHQRFETPLDTSDQQNLTFSGDIEKRFANGGVLALTLFHGDSIFDFRNSIYSLDSPPLAPLIEKLNDIHHVRAQDTGGSLVWSRQSGGVLKTWLAGADWHTISGDDRMNNFFRPDNSSGFPATRNGGDQLFAAGFVQATMAPVENLELTAGGRIQYLRNSNGYIGSFGGQGEVAAREYTYFEPRVDLRYSLPAGFALRGAYYRSYRAPNLSDQYYTQASGLFVQLPNPFLKPERLDGEELGLDFARSGFHSQITLYRAAINNYIVVGRGSNRAYSLHGWFMTQNQNAAAMQAQGIEAEVDWDIGAGFSAGFDYTLANSILKRNPLDPITAGQQIMDVPRHTETAGLSYVSPQGARISVDAHHISKTSWFATVQNDSDNPNRSFAGSNIVVDVYGSYPVTPNVDLYAEAQNLLGRRYHAVGYSEPLSSVVLGAPLEIFGGLRLRLR